jgi:hypothetical protein
MLQPKDGRQAVMPAPFDSHDFHLPCHQRQHFMLLTHLRETHIDLHVSIIAGAPQVFSREWPQRWTCPPRSARERLFGAIVAGVIAGHTDRHCLGSVTSIYLNVVTSGDRC